MHLMRRYLIFAMFILGSCHKFLDVQPTNAVGDDLTITDKASAENAVRGSYRSLSATGYYGATFQFDALMSGNALTYTQSSAGQLQFLYHTLTADNNDLKTLWAAVYKAINQVNHVIAKVPNVIDASLTDAYRSQLLGEGGGGRARGGGGRARAGGGGRRGRGPT